MLARGVRSGLAERAPVALEAALAAAARCGRPPAVVAGDLTLVRPLGWAGIPVVVVTTDADDPVLRSRYVHGHCLVPGFLPPHDETTARLLGAVGEQLRAALGRPVPLVYGQDSQLELLYRHRESLARSFLFVLNDETLAWSLHDKGRFFTLCEAAGVRVPRTLVPADGPALERALGQLTPPLLVKPRRKSDWKDLQATLFGGAAKARVFASAAELLAHRGVVEASHRLIVQEEIDAPVTGLCSFHGFVARDGRLLGWFSGRKLRTYPAVAGESAFLELVRDDDVEAAGRAVVEKLGIRGPFKVDLIRDARTGEVFTLEVNARFNLWHHLGAAHGVNLPLTAYEYLVDGRVPTAAPSYEPRQRWVNFYRDLQAFRDDPGLSAARWVRSLLFARTVHETFAWEDPVPFLLWATRTLRGYLRRGT